MKSGYLGEQEKYEIPRRGKIWREFPEKERGLLKCSGRGRDWGLTWGLERDAYR